METVGARCSIAALIGIVAGFLVTLALAWQAAILVGWDAAALCYLVWTWATVGRLDPAGTKRHANVEDPSRRVAEGIVLFAGVALLAAVGLVLIKAGQSHGGSKAYLITVGIVSVVLSWATVHTVFTLRYTRSHYQPPEGGVDFNEKESSGVPRLRLSRLHHRHDVSGVRYRSDDQTDPQDCPLTRPDVVSLRRRDRCSRHQHRGESSELNPLPDPYRELQLARDRATRP